MTNEEIIKQIKDFWCVDNFKNEILYWKFETDIPTNMTFHIGHPTNSHKGTSVGDILPYTRLPQVIKENYSECIVTVPEWFWPFFKSNPYVDNISNKLMKWGSLGTFGTSVQRTCNVWGVICKYYTPRVYINNDKHYRTIAICVNSKTGGKAKNIQKIDNVLKEFLPYFRIYQIGTSDDQILTNVHEYIFNITRDSLINILSKFEYYVGVQNSIYHLAKAVGTKVIGILPENVNPRLVVLPFLTQINHLEIEMLKESQLHRVKRWKEKAKNILRIDPNESHHIGWLYPDSCHLTLRDEGTFFCPSFTTENLAKAFDNYIFPFNESLLWDYYLYPDIWSNA